MARIQVLPLTAETIGSVTMTPFVVIIDKFDQHDEQDRQLWSQLETIDDRTTLQERLGARVVFVVDGALDVENIDPALHELAQAAVERVLAE